MIILTLPSAEERGMETAAILHVLTERMLRPSTSDTATRAYVTVRRFVEKSGATLDTFEFLVSNDNARATIHELELYLPNGSRSHPPSLQLLLSALRTGLKRQKEEIRERELEERRAAARRDTETVRSARGLR